MKDYKYNVLVCTQMFPLDRDSAIISGMIKNPFYQTLALDKYVKHVDVITTGETSFTGNIEGIDVHSVGNGWLKGVLKAFIYETKIAFKALKLNSKKSYDVIHIHHLNIPLIIFFKKIGLIKSKIIYTAHGTSTPELNAARQGSRINHFLLSINGYVQHHLDSFCWNKSDYLLSPSKFQISEMIELYKVKNVPIEVVYNGYQEDVYNPILDRDSLRKRYGIKHNDKVVLFVGRAAKKKGIDKLIYSMDDVVKEKGNIKLLLVVGYIGRQTSYRDEIKALSDSREYIKYYESIPESQLNEIYNIADLCVFPSIGYESIPTVIYESMATGCPILTQNSWGIPEVLTNYFIDEERILDADLSKPILEIISNESDLARSSEECIRVSKDFSWSLGGEKLAKIYEKVIGDKVLNDE